MKLNPMLNNFEYTVRFVYYYQFVLSQNEFDLSCCIRTRPLQSGEISSNNRKSQVLVTAVISQQSFSQRIRKTSEMFVSSSHMANNHMTVFANQRLKLHLFVNKPCLLQHVVWPINAGVHSCIERSQYLHNTIDPTLVQIQSQSQRNM